MKTALRKLKVKMYYSRKDTKNTPTPFAEFRAWVECGKTIRRVNIKNQLNQIFKLLGSRKKVAATLGVLPRSERRYRQGTRTPSFAVMQKLASFLAQRMPGKFEIQKKGRTRELFQKIKSRCATMEQLESAIDRMEWIFKSIFRAKRDGAIVGEIAGSEDETIDIDEAPNLGFGIQRYARFYSIGGRSKAEYDEAAIRRFEKSRMREYRQYYDELRRKK